MTARPAGARRQRGVSLVEGLIACVVLGLGVATVARLQAQLHTGSDIARQRSEAVRLAQEDLEGLRAFASLGASSGAGSYAAIVSAATTVDSASGYPTNTSYRRVREITVATADADKRATVAVDWTDRTGVVHRIVLDSIIAAADPAYAAALARTPSGHPVRGARGRSAQVPVGAHDLGHGRSAIKPIGAGHVAIVFDNASGAVSERCSAVSASTLTADLTSADLAGCDARPGYLLSGVVRFSSATPPDPGHADDMPLALSIALASSGGTYPFAPQCGSEALKTVAYTRSGSRYREAVPLEALPAFLGLASWEASGERFVAWHCVVYPLASGAWSGRADVVPSGWSIGTSAADFRVCRYAADADGSGAVDANVEHPARYIDVRGALADQNFLVVTGTQSCPVASAIQVSGAAGDVFVDLSTAPHQP